MGSIVTTCKKMAGGQSAVAGLSKVYRLTFGGTWALSDTVQFVFTNDQTAFQTVIGAGTVTAKQVNFVMTYRGKVNVVYNSSWAFSDNNAPTVFNDPNAAGNGAIDTSNQFGTPEDLTALATYQGKVALFSPNTVQIWNIDADLANYSVSQILANIGAISPHSVQSLGDLDVLFLSNTGIRSLRVHDSSLNAFVVDLGSAIDQAIADKLVTCSADDIKAAFGIVEPATNRYWLWLKDTIYVFSYYPQSKIIAWGTYTLDKFVWLVSKGGDGQTYNFFPEWFCTWKNQIYVLGRTNAGGAGDNSFKVVLVYGGTDNNTYDDSVCTATIPFIDGKRPVSFKKFTGLGLNVLGDWTASITADWQTSQFVASAAISAPNYDPRNMPFSAQGTHVAVKFVSTGSTLARISAIIPKWVEESENK